MVGNCSTHRGTKLAKVVQYARNEKTYLYRFLENPAVPPGKKRAGNAIRPFVVGRKNWLFSSSVKGAQASAMFYSLAVSATANGLNVEQYFADLFAGQNSLLMPWSVICARIPLPHPGGFSFCSGRGVYLTVTIHLQFRVWLLFIARQCHQNNDFYENRSI